MNYTQQILDMLADGRERYTSEIASKIGVPDAMVLLLLEQMHADGAIARRWWISADQEVSAWMKGNDK